MMMMATTSIIIIREKYKISPYSLPNLQIAICCIKINSKVPVVGENQFSSTNLTEFVPL